MRGSSNAWPLVAAALMVPLAACSDGTAPTGTLTRSDVEAVADFIGGIEADGPELPSATLRPSGSPGPTLARSGSYTATADCPAGGSRTVEASTQADLDPDTRIVQATWTHTVSFDDCSLPRRNTELTLDGSVAGEGSGSFQRPSDPGQPRTILSLSGTRTGTIDWSMGDRSGSCTIDLTRTWDADAQTMHIDGTVCDREVHIVRSRG